MCCAPAVRSALLVYIERAHRHRRGQRIRKGRERTGYQTWFTGYGLEVDVSSPLLEGQNKSPASGMTALPLLTAWSKQRLWTWPATKAKMVEKWVALVLPPPAKGDQSTYGYFLVYKKVGAYLLQKPSGPTGLKRRPGYYGTAGLRRLSLRDWGVSPRCAEPTGTADLR